MKISLAETENDSSIDAAQPVRRIPDIASCDDVTDQSGTDNFFADMARVLLGKDAGFQLHIITGFPERSCYRYASGERPVPVYFLRKLMYAEGGHVWHAAFMAQCKAQWWIDHQRAEKIAAAIAEANK